MPLNNVDNVYMNKIKLRFFVRYYRCYRYLKLTKESLCKNYS